MKNSNFLPLLAIGISLVFTLDSCRKKPQSPDDVLISHKDVIIGCKPGQPITLGIDPIKSNEFNFSKGLHNAVVAGPSCLNQTKTLYYSAGDDKMIDEIEISSGKVKRSFQTTSYPTFMHYRAGDHSIIYAQGVGSTHEYALFKLDLNSGNSSSLFTFTSDYGYCGRTSFMRNNDLYFLNGMGELLKVDLGNQTVSKVIKLTKVTNSLVYDNKLDKVFYMVSPTNTDFSLCSYTFSNNTDAVLKNYPDIKTYAFGSSTYNPGNNNYYFYNGSNERITIDVISLSRKIEKVSYPLINTEIVDCTVRQVDVTIEK